MTVFVGTHPLRLFGNFHAQEAGNQTVLGESTTVRTGGRGKEHYRFDDDDHAQQNPMTESELLVASS